MRCAACLAAPAGIVPQSSSATVEPETPMSAATPMSATEEGPTPRVLAAAAAAAAPERVLYGR